MAARLASALAVVLGSASLASAQTGVVSVPWPAPSAKSLNLTMGYGVVNATGTRFNWYMATLDDLSRFSIQLPVGGCAVRATTTATAVASKCAVAVNAGFFQFSPKPTYCLGEVVVGGVVEEWADDGSPLFATSVSGRTTYLGPLTRADIAAKNITSASSGFGFIVSGGRVNAAGVARARSAEAAMRRSRGQRSEEIAPRTVLAVDAQGRAMVVAIDGVEALLLGVTVDELADIFTGGAVGAEALKAEHAINMDGGGSTTMSASPLWPLDAVLFNRPTDTDTGPITERLVTCIACIAGE
jgi:exopolysaccharide biosynthesis protein